MRAIMAAVAMATGLASSACYTVKTVTLETFGDHRVKQVWVTRADQSVVHLKDAEVFGDKLRGFVNRELQEFPAADMQQIRVRQLARGRTWALVGGSAVTFLAVAVIVSGNNGDEFDGCIGGREGCYEEP
jgi:hypothetical protein